MNPQFSRQLEATPLDEMQFESILRSLAGIRPGAAPMPAVVALAGGPLGMPGQLEARAAGGVGPAPAQIATRAYDLYLGRGAVDGEDLADWLQAERELREAGAAAN